MKKYLCLLAATLFLLLGIDVMGFAAGKAGAVSVKGTEMRQSAINTGMSDTATYQVLVELQGGVDGVIPGQVLIPGASAAETFQGFFVEMGHEYQIVLQANEGYKLVGAYVNGEMYSFETVDSATVRGITFAEDSQIEAYFVATNSDEGQYVLSVSRSPEDVYPKFTLNSIEGEWIDPSSAEDYVFYYPVEGGKEYFLEAGEVEGYTVSFTVTDMATGATEDYYDNPLLLSITDNMDVVAVYTPAEETYNVICNTHGAEEAPYAGKVVIEGAEEAMAFMGYVVSADQNYFISADIPEGYKFQKWEITTENELGSNISEVAEESFSWMFSSNAQLDLYMVPGEEQPQDTSKTYYEVTVVVNPESAGSVTVTSPQGEGYTPEMVESAEVYTLSPEDSQWYMMFATPEEGYKFQNWIITPEEGEAYEVEGETSRFALNGNITILANFVEVENQDTTTYNDSTDVEYRVVTVHTYPSNAAGSLIIEEAELADRTEDGGLLYSVEVGKTYGAYIIAENGYKFEGLTRNFTDTIFNTQMQLVFEEDEDLTVYFSAVEQQDTTVAEEILFWPKSNPAEGGYVEVVGVEADEDEYANPFFRLQSNTDYTIVANADYGYDFAYWTIITQEGNSKTINTNPLTYRIEQNMQVIANFAPVQDTTAYNDSTDVEYRVVTVAVYPSNQVGSLIIEGADEAGMTEYGETMYSVEVGKTYEAYVLAENGYKLQAIVRNYTDTIFDTQMQLVFEEDENIMVVFTEAEQQPDTTQAEEIIVWAKSNPEEGGYIEFTEAESGEKVLSDEDENANEFFRLQPNVAYTLTANVENGYEFANWLLVDPFGTSRTLNANPLTYSFATDMQVIANFAPVQDTTAYNDTTFANTVTVLTKVEPANAGKVELSGVTGKLDDNGNVIYTLDPQTAYEVTATSAEGYTFVSWQLIMGGVTSDITGIFNHKFPEDAQITAIFKSSLDTTQTDTTFANRVTVLAVAQPANAGKVELTGTTGELDDNGNIIYTVEKGISYEIVARPADGYKFVSWRILEANGNGTPAQGNPLTYAFTGDAQVVAIFTEEEQTATRYNVTWDVYGVDATVGGAKVVVEGAEQAVTFQGYVVEPGKTYAISFEVPEGYKFAYATYVMGNMYDSLYTNYMAFNDDTRIMAYYEEDKTQDDTTVVENVKVWLSSSPEEGGFAEIIGVDSEETEDAQEYYMVNPNTSYQLVAYAEDGYTFANWLIMDAANQTKTLSANPLTYSFASEMRVIANFAPVQDTTQTVIVVAVASPEEGGQVDLIVDGAVWNPTKDAAGNTYYELSQNTTCTLAAVSYEGYTFAKWDVYVEGVPTTEVGADNVFTYTFKSNASVIAYFDGGETSDTTQTDTTVKTVTVLAVAEPANSGSVEITGVAATADYNGNSVYTLDPETAYEVVAIPAKGYKFLSWRIMDATTQGISVEGNPFTYQFTEDAQVIAIFTEDQPVIDDSTRYNVTWEVYGVPATVGGAEVVVAGAEKAVTFQGYIVEPGKTYGIRFIEPQGYKFAYATYVMGNMYDSLSAGNTMVFTDNTQIMAYYEEDKTSSDTTQTDTTDNTVTVWTLSQPTEGGSVEITGVTPSANYDDWLVYYLDSEVAYQLVATPANGYKFSAWRILSNDGQGVSLEENPMTYKFTENSQAIAIFTEESGSDTTQTDTTDNTVTVWTLSEPTQGGSVEITGVTPSAKYDGWLVYYLNPEVAYQLVATPADGYKFSSWRILSNDGQGVSLENNPTTYKFTENSQAIAIFTEEKYYTLTTITNLPNAGEAVYYPVESAYKEGETVMFFADSSIYNPEAFKFEAWIVNGVRQVERTIQVTMTRNTLVELVVSEILPPAYYHLYTMVPDSNAGAIYVTPEDTAYLEGTIVSLYPMIDTLNYDIDTWVVNGKRVAGYNLVLTMNKDYQVILLTKDKPVITNPEYNVTFIVRPDSAGSANYNSGMYEEGTVLSLAPYTYSNEYEFSNWYINGKYVQAKNPKVTITEETTIILMYKQKQQYGVNTSVIVKDNTEEEVAAVSLASGKYISGETYTLTPVIYDEDYKFSAWIINGNMVDEEEFEITITKSYQITLLVEPVEQGQEAPTQFSVIMNFLPDTNVCTANVTSGIYEAGQEIELKPIIYNQDEYEFNAWVVNGEVYSTEVVVVTVEKDMNISLIAVEKVLVEDDEIPEDVTVDLTAASDTTSSVSLIWTPVEDADYYTVDVMVGGVIVSSYVVDAEGRVIKSDKDVALNLDELIAAGVTYHFEIVPYTEDGEVIEEEIISGRFTTLKSTDAINETKAEVATNFKAYGVERAVVVENAENNVVSVFDINGRRVANTINVNDAKVRIAVPRMGVYVVRVGNAAAKVYVR